MPRKAFKDDLRAATERQFPGIVSVARGENDEDINLCFAPMDGLPVQISLIVSPDVGSYPLESTFWVSTSSTDPRPRVAAALDQIAQASLAMRIPELIATISERLQHIYSEGSLHESVLANADSDAMVLDTDEDSEDSEDSEAEYYPDSDDDVFSQQTIGSGLNLAAATRCTEPAKAAKLDQDIRHDLRAARLAGFSIGILMGMRAASVNNLVSLSIRVAKLGLSQEAMQAWDLEPQQYIVLLIKYGNGYKTFDSIISETAKSLDVSFRIGTSNRYKPTVSEALIAFTDGKTARHLDNSSEIVHGSDEVSAGFFNMFISSSLNDFTNDQLISLLKIRSSVGLGWDGAKRYFNTLQGCLSENMTDLSSIYYQETIPKSSALPDVVTSDHLKDVAKQVSFPLIAAQFSLRYLARCTEFCLVCHDVIDVKFEALKPYVCEKPLCLYQYMSLGFGPSVEHQILSQPYVVDLLVSFCYSSVMARRIRDYPVGMSLSVPPVMDVQTSRAFANPLALVRGRPQIEEQPLPISTDVIAHDVKLDIDRQEVTFDIFNVPMSPVRLGDWVVVSSAGHPANHYRVVDATTYPKVKLSDSPVTRSRDPAGGVPVTPATTPPPVGFAPATLSVYNLNFDDMDDVRKCETIAMLLETLPSITQMREFLEQQRRTSEPDLRAWKDRISPAAMGILRWIIASNRSCIVQVDKLVCQDDKDASAKNIRFEQRISNISDSWVQFRFAQGSPDKEQKFFNSLQEQREVLNPKYPTIFAWHGSSLANWHSIIRTGLDFKETMNGRAFGHGVYHALDQSVSTTYAGAVGSVWHGSELRISSAMSLNEIVNCPKQFESHRPYLVVQHIDWIQCRYLFIKAGTGSGNPDHAGPPLSSECRVEVEQDPKFTPKSGTSKKIGIPMCAGATSRAFRAIGNSNLNPNSKRRKSNGGKQVTPESMPATFVSDGESMSDIDFMFSDDEDSRHNKVLVDISQTDFVPGLLDQSTLPMLAEPAYATPAATRTLSRSLKEILAVQAKTPLHELGWYINPEFCSNLYQWIVELHSFDSTTPLAMDMKTAGVTSVVIELRFGSDFPFSPPFVRVIRPRFLPFTAGGGGHVTGGGAMCMELLTNSGWSSVSTIESVLMLVRMAMMNLEPRPARLEKTGGRDLQDYGTCEAIQAYERACRAHGWAIPPGLKDMLATAPGASSGTGPSSHDFK